jgi:hypothetical protein
MTTRRGIRVQMVEWGVGLGDKLRRVDLSALLHLSTSSCSLGAILSRVVGGRGGGRGGGWRNRWLQMSVDVSLEGFSCVERHYAAVHYAFERAVLCVNLLHVTLQPLNREAGDVENLAFLPLTHHHVLRL